MKKIGRREMMKGVSFVVGVCAFMFCISNVIAYAEQGLTDKTNDSAGRIRFVEQKKTFDDGYGLMFELIAMKQYEILAKPIIADLMAEHTKNYFEALIEKGFSREEALKIVIGMGRPPLSAGSGKNK